MKPIAAVFSDLHLHVFNQFNENNRRLKASMDILNQLVSLDLPLLFAGDWFHEDQHISNTLFDYLSKHLPDNLKVYGISGNHDMSELNNNDNLSPSLFRSMTRLLPNQFTCLEEDPSIELNEGIRVFGIPYLSYNIGLREYLDEIRDSLGYQVSSKRILLIHTDLHGASDTDGRKINSVQNMDANMTEFFKGFDLVFSGHIHKPQRITPHIIMVGAPNQQRKSDMGGKFGYWLIYEDMSVKFKKLKAPEFKFYIPGKDTIDEYHYWVPVQEGKENEEDQIPKKFTNTISKTKLAKRYCKERGIKSKRKVEALKSILDD